MSQSSCDIYSLLTNNFSRGGTGYVDYVSRNRMLHSIKKSLKIYFAHLP